MFASHGAAVAVQGSAPASVLIDRVSPSDSAMSTLRCRGFRVSIGVTSKDAVCPTE